MLSKEDLIFFGTCILMSNTANGSIDTATSIAKTIYSKIFEDDDNKEKMIVE